MELSALICSLIMKMKICYRTLFMWRNENFTQRRSSSQMPDAKRCRLECINKELNRQSILFYIEGQWLYLYGISKGYVEIAG